MIVGLGGSATVEGGTGAARGLGWTFRDGSGEPLPEGGGALADLAVIGRGWGLDARVLALADVETPLLGENGAAPVFGPQKGARPEEIVRPSRDGALRVCGRRRPSRAGTMPMGGAAVASGPASRLGARGAVARS